jgi:hypothetical protein
MMKDSSFRVLVLVAVVVIVLVATGLVKGSPAEEPAGPPGPKQLVITINAHEDAYIDEAFPNQNHGDVSDLRGGRFEGNDYDTLLKFDLAALPPDAVVISASLRLQLIFNEGSSIRQGNTIWVDAVQGNWSEMSVTWNNAPSAANQGDPPTTVPQELFAFWDVTNIVQGWVGGGLTNYGVRMRGDRSTEGLSQFVSREGLGDAPQLIVAYTSPSITPTPSPSPSDTPPDSPTPTLPGSGSCPGTVYVYADQDTYVSAQYPGMEFGHLDYLRIKRKLEYPEVNQRNLFVHFPIETLLPPGTNIYKATLRFRVMEFDADDSGAFWRDGMVYNLEEPFDESTTNWFNQPAMLNLVEIYDVPQLADWHTADITDLVRDWYSGAEPNYGVGIRASVPLYGWYAIKYFSRNYADITYRPMLAIECGDAALTPTPTPSRTPTRTPTATPTITPTPFPATSNIRAAHLGVTQGVQTWDHTVPLLEGKRTYVRLWYSLENPVPNYAYKTTAELKVYRNGYHVDTLLPINNFAGTLFLSQSNWYHFPGATFIFELPTAYTTGETRLEGMIDPANEIPESDNFDNDIERTVTFEPVRDHFMFWYLVKHIATDGTVSETLFEQVGRSWNYAENALPFAPNDMDVHVRFLEWDEATMGTMTCEGVNSLLIDHWLAEGPSLVGIYYGFMPGQGTKSCSSGIPANAASSWVGNSRSTMAHELGHAYSRHHTQDPRYDEGGSAYDIGCGAKTGCWFWGFLGPWCAGSFEEYPYSNGFISPYNFYVYGFYHNFRIESPDWADEFVIPYHDWKDLMTYCRPQIWPSDFTYKRIYERHFTPLPLSGGPEGLAVQSTTQVTPTDSLVAVGTIVSSTGEIEMQRLYVLPDVTWAPEPDPGEFAIVLRDATNAELLRHEFTGGLVDVEDFGNVFSFGELVPYVDGTVRVDIEGPTGVLTSVLSGASPPTVTVVRPNGGEVLSGQTAQVRWTASDPDGDPLSYNVQYSDDNGATWKLLAVDVVTNSMWINSHNLPGSDRAYIRVLVSDGIHTASDTSDGPFTVPNHHPSVQILSPTGGDIFIVSQTVGLRAQVFDVEEGSMDSGRLRWSSSLDGILGNGHELSLANLTPGEHTISLVARDAEGATNGDAVQITIYAGPEELPPIPDKLWAEPSNEVLDPLRGGSSRPLLVYNYNKPDEISWTATTSEPWVYLSDYSGTTAGVVTVWASTFDLPEGPYTATVTFTNNADPADSATVHLSIQARRFPIYLPLIPRGNR